MKRIIFGLLLLSLGVSGCGVIQGRAKTVETQGTTGSQARISTTTVGLGYPCHGILQSIAGQRHQVVATTSYGDAYELSKKLAEIMAQKGCRIEVVTQASRNSSSTYSMDRLFSGKAVDYTPPQVSSGGNPLASLVTLGVGLAVGKSVGVIDTGRLLNSDANAIANLVTSTDRAYGPINNARAHGEVIEGVKGDRNLVIFRLCHNGVSCAHAASAGDASLEELEDVVFNEGVLKLVGLQK